MINHENDLFTMTFDGEYQIYQQNLYLIFTNLKKMYDGMTKEILWKTIKKTVNFAYI